MIKTNFAAMQTKTWDETLKAFYFFADNCLERKYGMGWDSFPDLIIINNYVETGMYYDEIRTKARLACDELIERVKEGYGL